MNNQNNSGQPHDMTPEKFFDGPMVRRLCIIRFQCPLCMEAHEADFYVSLPATDLDEYVAQLRRKTQDWTSFEPALTDATIRFHNDKGDLLTLVQKAAAHGLPEVETPTIEVTSESAYTCDDCSRTFSTVRELRDHMLHCK